MTIFFRCSSCLCPWLSDGFLICEKRAGRSAAWSWKQNAKLRMKWRVVTSWNSSTAIKVTGEDNLNNTWITDYLLRCLIVLLLLLRRQCLVFYIPSSWKIDTGWYTRQTQLTVRCSQVGNYESSYVDSNYLLINATLML